MEEEGGGHPPAAGPAAPGFAQPGEGGELAGRISPHPQPRATPALAAPTGGCQGGAGASTQQLGQAGSLSMRLPVPLMQKGAMPCHTEQ